MISRRIDPFEKEEFKVIDLSEDFFTGPRLATAKSISRKKLEMKAKGWKLAEEENGVALYHRR